MNIATMINHVLPEGSILYKHNHGMFSFYMDESDFEYGEPYTDQHSSESLEDFLNRTIHSIMEKEQGTADPTVTIDYAINIDR